MKPVLTPRAREIAAAAREILEDEGPDALTMRRIAERLGIRAPSLYKHFPDKAALEAAIISAAFEEQAEAFERAVEGSDDPLAALGAAYRRFALAHPHLYRLMTDQELRRDLLAPGVEERAGMPVYRATGEDADRARAAWAFAHGMALLELANRFPPRPISTRPGASAWARFRGDRPLGCDRRRLGAEWPGGGDRARPGGPLGARARGRGDDRRRPPQCGADPARIPPRRVLRHPPSRARVAVPAQPAAGRARARVLPPRDPGRASPRRRHGGRAASFGRRDGRRPRSGDGDAYRTLMRPLATGWEELVDDLLGTLRLPRHARADVRFARSGLRSASGLARSRFAGARARALLAGNAAHSMRPLEGPRRRPASGLL